jgi:hypothetical protein
MLRVGRAAIRPSRHSSSKPFAGLQETMADDTLSKLLPGTIEQYDRAVRWSGVLLVALAAFHLTTFERFVDTTREMARSAEQKRQLTELSATTKSTSEDLKQRLATVKLSMTQRINAEFNGLRNKFALLNLDVAEVWCRAHATPAAAYSSCIEPAAKRAPGGNRQPQLNLSVMSQMAQMPIPAQRPDSSAGLQMRPELRFTDPALWLQTPWKLQVLSEELASAVSSLPERNDALLDLLEPFIDRALIAPVFANLNRAWRDEQLPALTAFAERSVRSPGPAEELDAQLAVAMRSSVETARRFKSAAVDVEFKPPGERRWWLTFGGKSAASGQLIEMVDSVADRGAGTALASLEKVMARLGEAETAKAEVLESLKQTLKQLNDGFEAQRKQLGDLVEPLKAVAIDLEFFCRHFALIVALAGAAAIVWPGEKLRVARLTALMAEQAGQDIAIWRWFEARRRTPAVKWIGDARPFILGVALIGWTLYVAYRLTTFAGTAPNAWREAAFGTAILLGAMAWRWSALRRT